MDEEGDVAVDDCRCFPDSKEVRDSSRKVGSLTLFIGDFGRISVREFKVLWAVGI